MLLVYLNSKILCHPPHFWNFTKNVKCQQCCRRSNWSEFEFEKKWGNHSILVFLGTSGFALTIIHNFSCRYVLVTVKLNDSPHFWKLSKIFIYQRYKRSNWSQFEFEKNEGVIQFYRYDLVINIKLIDKSSTFFFIFKIYFFSFQNCEFWIILKT